MSRHEDPIVQELHKRATLAEIALANANLELEEERQAHGRTRAEFEELRTALHRLEVRLEAELAAKRGVQP